MTRTPDSLENRLEHDASPHSSLATPTRDPQVAIVAACKVLEVLERQLADVNHDVESSVVGVCNGFHGMAQRAQAAVNSAQDVVGIGSESHGGVGLIDEIQKVLNYLLAGVKLSCDFSQEISEKLELLEKRLASVESELKAVEKIANKAKLVALNGQIEAARLGEKGLGFSVVAQETRTLAANAAETSDIIGVSIKELAGDLRTASEKIKERAQGDSKLFAESERKANGLLTDLQISHNQMLQSIERTSEISGQLRDDIGRSVMSMQFQDRISQRIGHVISTMNGLVGYVMPDNAHQLEPLARLQSDHWLAEFAASYTMDSERQAMTGGSQSADNTECSVELF